MTKKFKQCNCVHCLIACDNPTSDHVFPRSWYPETTLACLEKWQIPSCQRCNEEYSKIEADLLQRIGMCVSPESDEAKGIANKALQPVGGPFHAYHSNIQFSLKVKRQGRRSQDNCRIREITFQDLMTQK